MKKTYLDELNEIKTVKDLLTFIRMRCLDTSEIEHINRICDILGNAPVCDLREAANSDKNTFFMMVKHCWSIVQMIEFYNENCNPRYEAMTCQEQQIERLEGEVKHLQESNREMAELSAKLRTDKNRLMTESYDQGNVILGQIEEIRKLKSKLYDLEHPESNG